jgi:hypothetical protein
MQGEEKEQVGTLSFVAGNEYLKYNDNYKLAYVMGLSDMFNVLTKVYGFSELYADIEKTTKDITSLQTKAIFDKYLEEHPESWHCTAASIFRLAILEIVGEN